MRIKAAGLIIFTTFLVLIFGLTWQINDIQKGSADTNQLGKEQTVQPSRVENSEVTLSLVSDADKILSGQNVNYTISYFAKNDLQKVRIVGALGETNKKVYPAFVWELDDLKAGASGTFSVPITIQPGDNDDKLAVSRITLSEIQKPAWWGQDRREIIATADIVNQIAE